MAEKWTNVRNVDDLLSFARPCEDGVSVSTEAREGAGLKWRVVYLEIKAEVDVWRTRIVENGGVLYVHPTGI